MTLLMFRAFRIVTISSCDPDDRGGIPYAPPGGSWHLCTPENLPDHVTQHSGRFLSTASIERFDDCRMLILFSPVFGRGEASSEPIVADHRFSPTFGTLQGTRWRCCRAGSRGRLLQLFGVSSPMTQSSRRSADVNRATSRSTVFRHFFFPSFWSPRTPR